MQDFLNRWARWTETNPLWVDMPSPQVAFRAWRVKYWHHEGQYRLLPITSLLDEPWNNSPQTIFKCSKEHSTPDYLHTCGLYGTKSLLEARSWALSLTPKTLDKPSYLQTIVGVCLAEGKILTSDEVVLRAEKMQILALLAEDTHLATRLGAQINIPVVSSDELWRYLERYT